MEQWHFWRGCLEFLLWAPLQDAPVGLLEGGWGPSCEDWKAKIWRFSCPSNFHLMFSVILSFPRAFPCWLSHCWCDCRESWVHLGSEMSAPKGFPGDSPHHWAADAAHRDLQDDPRDNLVLGICSGFNAVLIQHFLLSGEGWAQLLLLLAHGPGSSRNPCPAHGSQILHPLGSAGLEGIGLWDWSHVLEQKWAREGLKSVQGLDHQVHRQSNTLDILRFLWEMSKIRSFWELSSEQPRRFSF